MITTGLCKAPGFNSNLLNLTGWVDAYSYHPESYDQAIIIDDALQAQAITTPPGSGAHPLLIGHTTVALDFADADFDASNNFEVICKWENAAADGWSGFSQVGVGIFLDLNAADPTELGAKVVYDSAFLIPPCYAQNVFRSTTLAESFTSNYESLPDDAGGKVWAEGWHAGRSYWWVIRVVDGYLKGYINGIDVLPRAVLVPDYCAGRTMHGIDIVSIRAVPGWDFGGGVVVPADDDSMVRVPRFICRPYHGPL